jgi:hypothetical protein
MFLFLLAGGLTTPRCRGIALGAALVYVLDVLAMSGLGRFYSPRHVMLAPLTASFDALRMGLGFDLTLLLALANLALFAAWCVGLRRVLDAPERSGAAYRPPEAVA